MGRFIAELPIATSFLMVPFSFLCIFLGIFCIFGYQFNLGYGLLKIESGNGWKSIFAKNSNLAPNLKNSPKKEEQISNIQYCVRKVNEGYQKAIRRREI
ncbi:hypothetical protein B9Z55_021818 [Caenorhabditis nigoni]|uniref:Uncharacterized protein n=1 Tax=Caenorhabditis nigoni TaxID=1611254 RepID=A0A2G5TTS7_9PELO|nr:hypothetical protein B9Z55_021818 [Caenorhabditis nigoni]